MKPLSPYEAEKTREYIDSVWIAAAIAGALLAGENPKAAYVLLAAVVALTVFEVTLFTWTWLWKR